jgi:hypothetical protein
VSSRCTSARIAVAPGPRRCGVFGSMHASRVRPGRDIQNPSGEHRYYPSEQLCSLVQLSSNGEHHAHTMPFAILNMFEPIAHASTSVLQQTDSLHLDFLHAPAVALDVERVLVALDVFEAHRELAIARDWHPVSQSLVELPLGNYDLVSLLQRRSNAMKLTFASVYVSKFRLDPAAA